MLETVWNPHKHWENRVSIGESESGLPTPTFFS